MKINSISNSYTKSQSFGAKPDKNTKILLKAAKRNGIDISEIKHLIKEVYPKGKICTSLFGSEKKNSDILEVKLKTDKRVTDAFSDHMLFLGYIDKIDKDVIDYIVKELKKVKQ